MKKKIALLLVLVVLGISVAGCDNDAWSKAFTSITGKIGDLDYSRSSTYTMLAYSVNNPNVIAASVDADENGYFTIAGMEPGSYNLRLQVRTGNSTQTYYTLYDNKEGPLGVVVVTYGSITNVNYLFTSMAKLNAYKVANNISTIGNIFLENSSK